MTHASMTRRSARAAGSASLAALLALGLGSTAPATLGCETCTDGSYCRGVTLSARFRAALDDLEGGTATVCWRDVCATYTETERAASSCDESPCRSVDLVFE